MFYKMLTLTIIVSFVSFVAQMEATQNSKNQNSNKAPEKSSEASDKAVTMNNQIDLSRNYDNDDKNFNPGFLSINGVTKSKTKYTVFVNVHEGGALQTGAWIPGITKRSLSWVLPYEQALRQASSHVKHAHDQSALLSYWSDNKTRNFVSFVLVPNNTEMEFKIGTAAPQGGSKEYRPGGGWQMRLKYVPKGTLVLTEPLTSGGKDTYNLYSILKGAISQYNQSATEKLDENLLYDDKEYQDEKDYVKATFSDVVGLD